MSDNPYATYVLQFLCGERWQEKRTLEMLKNVRAMFWGVKWNTCYFDSSAKCENGSRQVMYFDDFRRMILMTF